MSKKERAFASLGLVSFVADNARLATMEQAKRAHKVTQWALEVSQVGDKVSQSLESMVSLAEALMSGETVEAQDEVGSDK